MIIHEKQDGLISEPLADADAARIVGLIELLLKPSAHCAVGLGRLREGTQSDREQVG